MDSAVGDHISPLFYIFAGIALLCFLYNFRRAFAARIGRTETRSLRPWEVIRNALYFGLLQRKVSSRRFGYATIMHLCLAWGIIELLFATTVDFLATRGLFLDILPGKDTPWFAALNETGGLLLILGIVLALIRRHSGIKPEPLPQDALAGRGNLFGDTGVLLILLLLAVGGFLAESARLAIERPATAGASFVAYPLTYLLPSNIWRLLRPGLWWSHAVLALAFIALLPRTKLFHILTGIVNVALTNTSERGTLRPMNIADLMEDPDVDLESLVLGVGKVEDFTWKQLLDAEACTECARCSSVCPAYATGKPLSPMKTIQNIRHNLYARARDDRTAMVLIGELVSPEDLWSCTTCRACMEECPVLVDHITTIVDMRRFLVLSEGKPPEDAAASLEKTAQQGNPWGFPRENRLKWAKDAGLEVPLMADKQEADVLYWVGCAGAYDPRNQAIARAMVAIFQAAGVDYALLGTEESCTGDSARRIGEEYLYETLARQNIATLSKYRFNRIVTTCPHCYQTLGKDYRQLGPAWNVIHHSEYIQELISQGRLKMDGKVTGRVTYHDACYLGRHNGIYQSPREVIARTLSWEGKLVEMARNHKQSFCCGAGGGNMWYEVNQGERVNFNRFDQAGEVGADTIVTACAFCMIMLDDARKVRDKEERVQVKDIAELVVENLAPAEPGSGRPGEPTRGSTASNERS
ncbi:MAG: 4Fe-4S dicluster domain-containing protein [Calditrichaeota bacterium]|nr:4Fe-4S dicluster domain-containing protein [Calditrichota bacterium]